MSMQCVEFEQILEQDPDGSLPAAAALHLEACPDCLLLWDDLQTIHLAGGQLGTEEPAPPAHLWSAIQARLESEGLVRPAKSPRWSLGWLSSAPRLALAGGYLAVLLLGITLVNTGRYPTEVAILGNQNTDLVTSSLVGGVGRTLEGNIKQVIASLPERDVALADSFQHNLGIVDDLIAGCEKSVREQPDDPVARDYLYGAYEQKAVLLATAMDRSTLEDR